MHASTGCGKSLAGTKLGDGIFTSEAGKKEGMRGQDEQHGAVFSYVSAEQRIAAEHPLRRIRQLTDVALGALSPGLDRLYAGGGVRRLRRRSCCGGCCCKCCTGGAASGC